MLSMQLLVGKCQRATTTHSACRESAISAQNSLTISFSFLSANTFSSVSGSLRSATMPPGERGGRESYWMELDPTLQQTGCSALGSGHNTPARGDPLADVMVSPGPPVILSC